MNRSHIGIELALLAMYAAAMGALFVVEPPSGNKEPLFILVGGLSAAVGAIVNWRFGSSAGSREKDKLAVQWAATVPAQLEPRK